MDSDKMLMDSLNPFIFHMQIPSCFGEGPMSGDKDVCYEVRMNKNTNSSGEISFWFGLDFLRL